MLSLALLALPAFAMREDWSVSFPQRLGSAGGESMILSHGRVFFGGMAGRPGHAYGCLDAKTGHIIWQKSEFPGVTLSGIDGKGRLIVQSDERVRQLDPLTGETVWSMDLDGGDIGPFVLGDRMVLERAKGKLVAIDLPTHRTAWTLDCAADLGGPYIGRAAAVVRNDLWAATDDGKLLCVRLSDGKLLRQVPSPVGDLYGVVPMGERLAVTGKDGFAGLRERDGRLLWQRKQHFEGTVFYAQRNDELWLMPYMGGELYRCRARDGKRVGAPAMLTNSSIVSGPPVPYGNGYVIPADDGVLRLDRNGRPVAMQSDLYTPQVLVVDGKDLVGLTWERVYRLTPGTEPLPPNGDAEIKRLIAKPYLTGPDLHAIWHYGRAAIPALLAAMAQADDARRESIFFLLEKLVDARDTEAMFGLADAAGTFSKQGERGISRYWYWMQYTADPDWLAARLLPRLKASKDPDEQGRLVGFIRRSTRPEVVDDLFARLKDPQTPRWIKGEIYASIAVSGRPEVLQEILRIRSEGRRLDRPTRGLSTVADRDGDGIVDAFDANPEVAPRKLNETERVLLTAFDARFRFGEAPDEPTPIAYGPGIRPFELVGYSAGLQPQKDDRRDIGPQSWGLSFETLSLDGEVVRFSRRGTEALVRVAKVWGYGTEARLRKMRGEWFVVSMRTTWQN
jgi:outer membrane protein assembly factor BamB